MKNILNIVYLFILVILVALIYVVIQETNASSIASSNEQVGWCGTCLSSVNSTDSQLGKKLFKNNCARCHAKNMKSDATGPALGGTFDKWQKDTASYHNYLNGNPDEISNRNRNRIKAVMNEWKSPNDFRSHDFLLSRQEVVAILTYIEM